MRNLGKKIKQKAAKYSRRKHRINLKIKKFTDNPRVVINKSNMFIKAQVIAIDGKVLSSITDKGAKGDTKTQRAESAGTTLAEKLVKTGLVEVSFDRNGYLYHGRVKAFAEGMRKGGVKL
ncbi:MAG: 50S ribosomal protein L18 [Candidatus Absconditicoccaceae bacterium]